MTPSIHRTSCCPWWRVKPVRSRPIRSLDAVALPIALSIPLLCSAVSSTIAQGSPSAIGGTVVGYATIRSTNEPLGLADVTVERFGIGTFAGADGVFRLRGLPAGPVTIRVRRLGFVPAVVNLTIVSGREDTVRVALVPIALQLERLRVSDAVCPQRAGMEADTATLAILGQIRDNAERNAILAREFPFVASMERTIGDEQASPALVGRSTRVNVVRVDTATVAGEHEWRYAPGNLIRPNADAVGGSREKMIVPQLSDFADDVFIDAHCFRYAGLVAVDGQRRIRVDFEPIKTIREPDLRGSMYLDTASYQIVRTSLLMERPAASDTWHIRVDTWFREILPALPVVDRVCMRTIASSTTARGERQDVGGAAVEAQRLINFEFERGGPADLPRVEARTASPCPR
jgi:hypothetical protein